ncbi:hypothetical protein GB937_005322 [Aspergillus fischeri]|nr:hypothetical protein GB937_005322 [Aspergillus fischeri]
MGSINVSENPSKFILTAEALNNALPGFHMATRAIHADDFVSPHRAIAPGMHTAVNFRYARDPDELVPEENKDPNAPFDSHIYSRYTAPNSNRLEVLLRSLIGGEVITYSTELSAFHAMLILLNPKRIFIGDGYHGCHSVVDIIHRLTGIQKLDLTQIDQAGPGDIIHVEMPLNPTGEARNLAYYRAKASEKGAYLTVDSTFAPPPLQNPLEFGTDIVMHSGTNVMGSFEGWLGIRSARTMQLRVTRQAQTAERLARWLHEQLQDETSPIAKVLSHVQHVSLQEDDLKNGWLQKQMPGGFGPVFAVWTKNPEHARRLPSRMFIFQHATSLGGVESLMEWRAMSDARCDHRLLRISCGIEEFDDLKADFLQGLQSLLRDFP